MGGKHRPGYSARRRRIERYVLDRYRTTHPDEYAAAWADGETLEAEKEKAE